MKNKKWNLIFLSLTLIGVGLRIFQFLFNRSLWYDEAMLGLNIIEKDFSQLCEPLDYNQVAPIIYLWIQKSLTLIFGNEDWVLRIQSLVASIIFLFFSFRLAKKLTSEKIAGLTVTILSLSFPLVYYATEAKPYIIESMIFVLIFYSFLRFEERKGLASYWVLSGLGMIVIWYSFSSIFLLTTLGGYIFSKSVINPTRGFSNIFLLFLWSTSFLLFYFLIIHDHPNQTQMSTFWEGYFPPAISSISEFSIWIIKRFSQFFYLVLGYPKKVAAVTILLFGVGVWESKKPNHYHLYLLFLPLAIHFVISYFNFYPFIERLVLYNAFPFALFVAIGFFSLIDKFGRIGAYGILLSIMFLFLPYGKKFPIQREEIKELLLKLNNEYQEEDAVYVYYGAVPAFTIYKNHFPKLQNVSFGTENRKDYSKYIDEINAIKKERIWVIFTHTLKEEYDWILNQKNYLIHKVSMPQNCEQTNEKILLLRRNF